MPSNALPFLLYAQVAKLSIHNWDNVYRQQDIWISAALRLAMRVPVVSAGSIKAAGEFGTQPFDRWCP
jgi:hypothetical protein